MSYLWLSQRNVKFVLSANKEKHDELHNVHVACKDVFLEELEDETIGYIHIKALAKGYTIAHLPIGPARKYTINHGKDGYAKLPKVHIERLKYRINIGRHGYKNKLLQTVEEHIVAHSLFNKEQINQGERVASKLCTNSRVRVQ